MNELKDLRVFIKRLPESVVEEYWKKYIENSEQNAEIVTDDEDIAEDCYASDLTKPFLQEAGLNVSVIAKNDKKMVKLNNLQLAVSPQPEATWDSNSNQIMVDNYIETQPTQAPPSTAVSYCYQCSKCTKIFTDQTHLKAHLSAHNNNSSTQNTISHQTKSRSSTKHICNECGMQFFQQSEFNRHLLTHEGIKPYKCSICSMQFYDTSSKNRHEKEHSGLKPFRCYICSFEFTRASNLRAHLLKVHSSEIGKSVIISKSNDNKLKFEFNLDAINLYKEQQRLNKMNKNNNSHQSQVAPNNAVIYIKDPKDKNSDIQHMVVYVDGKPVFIQNPKIPLTNQNQTSNTQGSSTKSNQPVAKIPYLLAAAAAAAAAAQSRCTLTSQNDNISPQVPKKEIKKDYEYQQIVSMLKQKNEKLYNPLSTNTFVTNEQFSSDSLILQNHHQQNNHFY